MLGSQHRYVVVALAVVALLLVGQTAFATVITVSDSSFEGSYTGVSGGHYISVQNGTGTMGAWSTVNYVGWDTNGAVGAFANNGVTPDGTHVAFLQAVNTGIDASMSQSLSGFNPGTLYEVDFAANANKNTNRVSPPLQAFINGVQEFSQTITPVEAVGSYTQPYHSESFTFTATASSQTLTFLVPGAGGDKVALIDNISIHNIPEPSMLVLLATGLIGLLAYAWRKRR